MKSRIVLVVMLVIALLAPFAPRTAAQTAVACEQEYSVTAGDWLSNIADKFYGDISVYNAIFLATNLKAQTDSTFATLTSPDAVEVGQKLCIPSKTDAEQLMNAAVATATAIATTAPSNATAQATTAPATATAPEAATPPATAGARATPAPVTASKLALTPEQVTFGAYLGNEIQGRIVPAAAYDNSAPPGPVGAPAHVAFSLDGQDRLWVIPSAEYQAQWNAAGNNTITDAVARLRLLLRDKPETYKPPLPFLPAIPATNDVAARIRYLDFDGGSGVAFIGRWAQDPSPVLSPQLYYSFVGLTNDGKYIVSFRYPVQTSALPDTLDELTPEHLAEIEANPQYWLDDAAGLLDRLPNSAFGPDLSRLDALVFSIRVPSVGAPLPPPSGSLPTNNAPSGASGTSSSPPATSNSPEKARLLAADWKWVSTTSATTTLTVDAPAKYTVRFNNANGFGIVADCNFGAGNFSVSGTNLTIIDLQASEIACGAKTLDAQFTAQLLLAESFSFEGTNLLIRLKGDAGVMKFRR